jgi:hypothetical protein
MTLDYYVLFNCSLFRGAHLGSRPFLLHINIISRGGFPLRNYQS